VSAAAGSEKTRTSEVVGKTLGAPGLLVAQAILHERFAFIAFFVAGIAVASFHSFLPRHFFGAQAFFHESFAFITGFAFRFLVASGHFGLLRVVPVTRSVSQPRAASEAQRSDQGEKFFHDFQFLVKNKRPTGSTRRTHSNAPKRGVDDRRRFF
jgi:hypothetical protein